MHHGRRAVVSALGIAAVLGGMTIAPAAPEAAPSPADHAPATRAPLVPFLAAENAPGDDSAVQEESPGDASVSTAAAAPQPDPAERTLPVIVGGQGIPAQVRAAYERAGGLIATADPDCGMTWELLAGVGRTESGHASGGRLDADGTTRGRILGPRLDGTLPGAAVIVDSDEGALDGDVEYDRALGPMQFLPGTWASYGADGNDDGIRDPHNVADAAFAAARYLCAGGGDLSRPTDLAAALFRYNRSVDYGLTVQAWAHAYRTGGAPVIPARSGVVPEPAAPPTAEPAPDPGAVLTEPEGAGRSGDEAGTDGPAADPRPGPDGAPPTEPPPAPAADGFPASDGEGDVEGEDVPDGVAAVAPTEPGTRSAPVCDTVLLGPSAVVVLPDLGGLLLRFPLDQLPSDCDVVSATLVLDPGADAADRTVRVEMVADAWSENTVDVPRTAGDPVDADADAGTGERRWSVDALLAALVEGAEDSVLLSTEPDDNRVPLTGGDDARLEVLLGPAEGD